MPLNKVTQSRLAQELQLSRNTVFRALNDLPGVAEATREIVKRKAAEMQYSHPSLHAAAGTTENHVPDIVLLCHSDAFDGFWSPIVKSCATVLSEKGAVLRLVVADKRQEDQLTLPPSVVLQTPDGMILCGNFRKEYYELVASAGLPAVSMDSPVEHSGNSLLFDTIMMENFDATYALTEHLIRKGHTYISFAGNPLACKSFYERWCGFCKAMQDYHYPIHENTMLTENDSFDRYSTPSLMERLKAIPHLPTAFVCVNDMIALNLYVLRYPPYNLFNKLEVSGFDNSAEYMPPTVTPYSTVEVHSTDIGSALGEQILWRMQHPDRPFRTLRINSTPILR
jgi:putative ribose operon repressor